MSVICVIFGERISICRSIAYAPHVSTGCPPLRAGAKVQRETDLRVSAASEGTGSRSRRTESGLSGGIEVHGKKERGQRLRVDEDELLRQGRGHFDRLPKGVVRRQLLDHDRREVADPHGRRRDGSRERQSDVGGRDGGLGRGRRRGSRGRRGGRRRSGGGSCPRTGRLSAAAARAASIRTRILNRMDLREVYRSAPADVNGIPRARGLCHPERSEGSLLSDVGLERDPSGPRPSG